MADRMMQCVWQCCEAAQWRSVSPCAAARLGVRKREVLFALCAAPPDPDVGGRRAAPQQQRRTRALGTACGKK